MGHDGVEVRIEVNINNIIELVRITLKSAQSMVCKRRLTYRLRLLELRFYNSIYIGNTIKILLHFN